MFRPQSTDGHHPRSPRPLRRLRAGALALGSGYQRNRDALEPALRAGVDFLALLALLARRAARPSPGPSTPAAPGAAR